MSTILEQYNTEQLRERLMEFPRRIKEQKAVVREAREEAEGLRRELEVVEAELFTDIQSEIDGDTNKPKFSNEKAREAELKRRKANDPEYSEKAEEVRQAERKQAEQQDYLEQLIDEYKSYRYITRLTVEELSLHNEEEKEESAQMF